jgi:hypothetical protein
LAGLSTASGYLGGRFRIAPDFEDSGRIMGREKNAGSSASLGMTPFLFDDTFI